MFVRLRSAVPDAVKSAGEKAARLGQEAIGLDRLAAGLTGAGVKIGLIDSAATTTSPPSPRDERR